MSVDSTEPLRSSVSLSVVLIFRVICVSTASKSVSVIKLPPRELLGVGAAMPATFVGFETGDACWELTLR